MHIRHRYKCIILRYHGADRQLVAFWDFATCSSAGDIQQIAAISERVRPAM